MKILGIDTSALTASAAVMSENEIVGEVSFTNGLTHSQTIMPMIDYCLKGASLSVSDIDIFAVSNGPGSFTGLRIGIGTVKGLAYACGKMCVGVSSLTALAYNIAPTDALVVPIMDARRNQVYCAAYKYSSDILSELFPPSAKDISSLCSEIKEKAIFVGDGVKVYRERISEIMGNKALFAPPKHCLQSAASVCFAALNENTVSPEKLEAVYLRKPQAEREREERRSLIKKG